MELLFAIAVPYLLGSISFAWLAVRLMAGRDLRSEGTKNLGARNALRVLGPVPGSLVFSADVAKGWAALWLVGLMAPHRPQLLLVAALMVVVGHCFPLWLKFQGGKGLASGAGACLYLNPWLALAMVFMGALGLALLRNIYLAAILGIVAFVPLLYFLTDIPGRTMAGVAIAAVVMWQHRHNIQELVRHKSRPRQ